MAKKALIILAQGFEDIEAVTAIDILRRADIDVTVAGLGFDKVKGARGTTVLADQKLSEKDVDFDAVVLPGGMPGATNLSNSPLVKMIITKMNQEKKLIAAICASPSVVLAPLGILDGRSVTGYPGMTENFSRETTYRQDAVVVDGSIITSRGPGTALVFALAIVEKLVGKEAADRVKKATLAD